MSTTIDSKVVEMRFDNQQFERGVSQSMSTLDKLKAKLNLSGAAKGLQDINKAAQNMSFAGVGVAIDGIKVKFSALNAIVTSKIMHLEATVEAAAKRMMDAISINPVKDGYTEYETQMNAVQTILANTRKEGTTVKDVNEVLDELNNYADKTIYNFTQMTNNIGTFTAAGVKLKTSASAIKGIANLAAVSGSTSQQASTAMYQLSQAIATGTVKLMDWNSVVNAGMGGQVFQDALIRTSEHLQTGAKAAIEAKGSFRESLSTGWLTAEVLTNTLDQFATAADTQQEYQDAVKKFVEQGYTQQEAEDMADMAKTAGDAATKVKTFSQLIDTLKEALGSGWTESWRIVIGDFEEARELWTSVSDRISGYINKFADARNELLTKAFGGQFLKITDSLNTFLVPANEVVKTLTDLDEIVTQVIRGDWGNYTDRYNKLTESGYNWMRVQNGVNETLGDSYRYTDEQIAAQDELIGVQQKQIESVSELSTQMRIELKNAALMSEEQLRSKGYTDEQIASLRKLQETAEKLGLPFGLFIDQLDQINGRWLMIRSMNNVMTAVIKLFKTIGKAWRDVFKAMDAEDLFNIIAGIHKFTTSLILSDGSAEKLERTLRGVFSVLDIIKTFVTGGVNVAFRIFSAILNELNIGTLEFTARIGDALYGLRNWLLENTYLTDSFDFFISKIPPVIQQLKEWYHAIKDSEATGKIVTKLKDAYVELLDAIPKVGSKLDEWFNAFAELPGVDRFVEAIKDILKGIKDLATGEIKFNDLGSVLGDAFGDAVRAIPETAYQIGVFVIEGFENGIMDGTANVIHEIVDFCIDFVKYFADALGVHSPSVKAYEIAQYFFQGFRNGVNDCIGGVMGAIEGIGSGIVDTFKSFFDMLSNLSSKIDWGKVFAGGSIVTLILFSKKISAGVSAIASVFEGIGGILEGAGKAVSALAGVFTAFSGTLKALSLNIKAEALKTIAEAVVMLAGAVAALSLLNVGKMWSAVGAIAVLGGVLVGLTVALDKFSDSGLDAGKDGIAIKGINTVLLQLGFTIGIMAGVIKVLGSMDEDEFVLGIEGLGACLGALAVMMISVSLLADLCKGNVKGIIEIGGVIKKMAASILIMALVFKISGMLDSNDMTRGFEVLLLLGAFVLAMAGISNITNEKTIESVSNILLKVAGAALLMAITCKYIGTLTPAQMGKSALFMAAFTAFVAAMVGILKVGNEKKVAEVGNVLLAVSASMLIMVLACKIAGGLNLDDMIKAGLIAVALLVVVATLAAVTKISNEQQMGKVAGTILAFSVALAIVAGVCILLGFIDEYSLKKGVTVIGLLSLCMIGIVTASKIAGDAKGTILELATAIGVIAVAMIALSFLDWDGLKLAGTAMLAITVSLAALMFATKFVSKETMGSLLVLAGIIAELGIIIYLLAKLPVKNVTGTAAGLSALLLSLAISLSIISNFGTIGAKAIPGMAIMLVVMAGLAGILQWCAKATGMDKALEIAAGLSIMLVALSESLALLGIAGKMGTAAFVGIIALIVLIGGVAVLLNLLTDLVDDAKDLDRGIEVVGKVGTAIGSFFGNIISAFVGSALDVIPAFGAAIGDFGKNVKPFIEAMGTVDGGTIAGMTMLFGAIVELIGANFLGTISLTPFTGFGWLGQQLSAFALNVLPFITTMRMVDKDSVESAKSMAEMFDILVKANLVNAIGKIIGSDSDFSEIGAKLCTFGTAVKDFSDVLTEGDGIDSSAITAAKNAADIILALQDGMPRSGGFKNFFCGTQQDIETFGKQCEAFGEAIRNFATSVTGDNTINLEQVQIAADAGKAIASLQDSLPRQNGWIQTIAGTKDLKSFSESISAFGEAIVSFSGVVSSEGAVNKDAITNAADAGKALSDMEGSIPSQGGWWQNIAGKKDMKDFGDRIEAFGEAITKFCASVSVDQDAVESSKNAGLTMAELEKAIPEKHWLDGRVELDDFGNKIQQFGDSLVAYNTTIKNANMDDIAASVEQASNLVDLATRIGEGDFSTIEQFGDVGTIATILSNYSNNLADFNVDIIPVSIESADKLANLINKISGIDDSGISKFKLGNIGEAMEQYVESIADVNPDTILVSVTAASRLATFINGLATLDDSGVDKFKVGNLGTVLRLYAISVIGIDFERINESIEAAEKMRAFIAKLAYIDTKGVSLFDSAISTLGQVSIDKVLAAFSGSEKQMYAAGANILDWITKGISSKKFGFVREITSILESGHLRITLKMAEFLTAGTKLMSNLMDGVASKRQQFVADIAAGVNLALIAIKGQYNNFVDAGSYLGSGLLIGITRKKDSVYAAGYELGKMAIKGERDGQASHSPSKLAIQSGEWIGEGLIIGLKRMSDDVYDGGYGLGSEAVDSMSNSISRIAAMMDSDMDTQPTIRPVVDLSNVQNGVSSISSMFGQSFGVSAYSDISSLDIAMNRRIQNGSNNNDDVVAAISKLQDKLGSLERPSYNINGVTYDDGSEIADAISTIVRATKVGRRM